MLEMTTSLGATAGLQVLDLGLESYAVTLSRQEELVGRRFREEAPDTLILVEHPPVVTLGRAKTRANLLLGPAELAGRGVEYFEITRGGDATYHAPGQLVGYPIFDLRRRGRDVLRFCRDVEAALIASLADFGLAARGIAGEAGVWVGDRKIASLGISVRRWITFHGFALNVTTDLTGFQVIRPCGKDPEVMTSMAALLSRPIPMTEVRRHVGQRFVEQFGFVEVAVVSA